MLKSAPDRFAREPFGFKPLKVSLESIIRLPSLAERLFGIRAARLGFRQTLFPIGRRFCTVIMRHT